MIEYRRTDSDIVIRVADGACIGNGATRDRAEYEAWREAGGVPAPYIPPPAPTPPTLDEIYDQTIQTQSVLKSVVLAINDGSLAVGGNRTGAQIKAIIKAKM